MQTIRPLQHPLHSPSGHTSPGLRRRGSASRLIRVIAALAVAAISGRPLASQPTRATPDPSAAATGTVNGVVTGADKAVLYQARVRVVGTPLSTVTRADGGFEITQVPVGSRSIEITMIGYSPKTQMLTVEPGGTIAVRFALEPVALDTVTVTANESFFSGLGGFEQRKARGAGRYFTREDIKAMHARQITDILRRVPGMQISAGDRSFSGGTATAQGGRSAMIGMSAAHPCTMMYYVNGTPFPLGAENSINQYVASDDVVAIEVYNGSSQIPPEFNSSQYGARCGVVAIWTRSALDARPSR